MSYSVYLSGSTQDSNVGVLNYGTEESRMQQLADLVKKYIRLGKGDIVAYRNNGSMSLNQTISDSNAKKVGAHLALHSNAGGGDGTEAYYHYTSSNSGGKGKLLAELVYNAVAPITIGADNGVKSDNTLYSSGLAELRETTAPAALIEVIFHDNKADVIDYLNKVDQIAKALAMAIYKYFGVKYSDDSNIVKTWEQILKETSKYTNVWVSFVNNHLEVNLKGLIEDLYYKVPNGNKTWEQILKETSKYSDVWISFVNKHPEINLKGLIENLYNTVPK